jgi:glycosyltransferase involved in cell wall biosynthesis
MLSPEKVNALYKLCEFYVAPAYSEGFCIPILEAYRWNKPSVSINHPPFNEIITSDETGLLIPYRSVSSYQDGNIEMTLKFDYSIDDLANAMIKLHQDSELREKMAEKIEAKKPNFDMFKQYPKLLEYF